MKIWNSILVSPYILKRDRAGNFLYQEWATRLANYRTKLWLWKVNLHISYFIIIFIHSWQVSASSPSAPPLARLQIYIFFILVIRLLHSSKFRITITCVFIRLISQTMTKVIWIAVFIPHSWAFAQRRTPFRWLISFRTIGWHPSEIYV